MFLKKFKDNATVMQRYVSLNHLNTLDSGYEVQGKNRKKSLHEWLEKMAPSPREIGDSCDIA